MNIIWLLLMVVTAVGLYAWVVFKQESDRESRQWEEGYAHTLEALSYGVRTPSDVILDQVRQDAYDPYLAGAYSAAMDFIELTHRRPVRYDLGKNPLLDGFIWAWTLMIDGADESAVSSFLFDDELHSFDDGARLALVAFERDQKENGA